MLLCAAARGARRSCRPRRPSSRARRRRLLRCRRSWRGRAPAGRPPPGWPLPWRADHPKSRRPGRAPTLGGRRAAPGPAPGRRLRGSPRGPAPAVPRARSRRHRCLLPRAPVPTPRRRCSPSIRADSRRYHNETALGQCMEFGATRRVSCRRASGLLLTEVEENQAAICSSRAIRNVLGGRSPWGSAWHLVSARLAL